MAIGRPRRGNVNVFVERESTWLLQTMGRRVELRHENLGLSVGPPYGDLSPVATDTQLADSSYTPADRPWCPLGVAGYFVDSKRPDGGVTGVVAEHVSPGEKKTAVYSPRKRRSQLHRIFQHLRRTAT